MCCCCCTHGFQVPRQIPEVPWYRRGLFQSAIAGLLPFSAISIELHYIFASVWGRKVRWSCVDCQSRACVR